MMAKVYVVLKEGILDPQGKAIQQALLSLGFDGVSEVRVGKYLEIHLKSPSKAQAESEVKGMCEKLLSNPVIENFRYEILD
jgi:phosphoribosylformylglycinamidine synthase PurS subunit